MATHITTTKATKMTKLNKTNFTHLATTLNIVKACMLAAKSGKIQMVTNKKGKVWLGVERVYGGLYPFRIMSKTGQDCTQMFINSNR